MRILGEQEKMPAKYADQWRNYARNNPGKSYSAQDFAKINRDFKRNEEAADRQARQQRRDLELYQQKWEELSGTNTQAPEYIPRHPKHYPDGSFNDGRFTEQFLQSRATELKARQRRMSRNQQQQPQVQQPTYNAAPRHAPNGQNNANPYTQNPQQQKQTPSQRRKAFDLYQHNLERKKNDDMKARQQRRDLELYQQNWEEISGSNTQAPEYMPQYGEKYYPGSDEYGGVPSNYNNKSKLFLEGRGRELKERQRTGIMTNLIGDTINTPTSRNNTFKPRNPMEFLDNYNGYKSSRSAGPSPSMQNPFQF